MAVRRRLRVCIHIPSPVRDAHRWYLHLCAAARISGSIFNEIHILSMCNEKDVLYLSILLEILCDFGSMSVISSISFDSPVIAPGMHLQNSFTITSAAKY